MKINQFLGLAAAVLLILSGWTYRESVTRAERFERGQKFLPNLNPDEIAEIVVKKGEEETQLERQGDEFVIVNADGYPAKNESVNRFIRDVLELSLEKEVGSGEGLEEELEINPAGENTLEVALKNTDGEEMVRFLVGKGADGGGGNFVCRTDQDKRDVYLTDKRVYLSAGADSFLKKQIVDVKGEDITAIFGADYQIDNEDGAYKLADLPAGQKESSKVNSAKYMLSSLAFTKHYLADAPEVRTLRFDREVKVDLSDDSGYQLLLAEADDKHYLRVQGYHKAQEVSITREAGDEEVQQTADTLERINELQDFNGFHGSWVYEISEGTANKLQLKRSELMEDA